MGNPKQKWTAEEEKALKQGVLKHGAGKWKNIHNDPEFHCHLSTRSNIDLKDKWRNMSSGQGPREKSRTPRPKPTQDISPAPVTPVKIQTQSVLPVANKPVIYQRKEEPAKDSADVKKVASDTHAMIFEALAAATDRIGLDIGTIAGYIEQRMTVKPSQNFRKQLGTKLRNLVKHDKLEKVDNNCYRLKTSSSVEINRIDNRPKQQPQPLPANNKISKSLEEAAKTAAYKVVEAEETAYCAALAVTEYERLSQMQEETDSILHLAKEIYDRCHNREILLVS